LAPLLKLLNTPEEIFSQALLYLRIYYAGCPITMAYNYAASHLRAFGNSSVPLKATVIASIVNIGLDILFVGTDVPGGPRAILESPLRVRHKH
jgi:Na+-driven multidrug efflux pump